jgi:hypothetical protein
MPEYRTPGVYIEEISAGPRPVAASSTTETGFIAFITLPAQFAPGRGKAAGMLLPVAEEKTQLSWTRALAFRSLAALEVDAAPDAPAAPATADDGKDPKKPAAPAKPGSSAPKENRLQRLVNDTLAGKWTIAPPNGDSSLALTSDKGQFLKIPISRTLLAVADDENGNRLWDLSFSADEQLVLQTIAGYALMQDVKHGGRLRCVDEAKKPQGIDIGAIQERLQRTAPAVSSMDGFDAWRSEFGRALFNELLMESDPTMTAARADVAWESLSAEGRRSWEGWLRAHPGFRRLEIGIRGFFENGGKTAFIACGVQAHGAAGPNKRKFLEDSFDGVKAVAMLCAPGLEFAWQQALLEYAGPKGRGDLFAVLDTARYLLTKAPRSTALDPFRWTQGDSPYEVGTLETCATPQQAELRFGGYSADAILDRTIPRDDGGFGAAYGPWIVVDNPLSTGPHDRYVIAPPSGHIAGVIAATDLKGGGGVHKAPANELVAAVAELVTSITDREQEALNMKSINIIRHRPGAGLRVWGARTTASDALWRYVNVRRMFLFVERSVRDAIQWAVFLPNSDRTRADLRNTIAGFLYSLYSQGMLDGATWKDSFTVQCNRDNNPDVDVRNGLMTVDVSIRPLFPAEFIRVRFRQSPMQSETNEG